MGRNLVHSDGRLVRVDVLIARARRLCRRAGVRVEVLDRVDRLLKQEAADEDRPLFQERKR